MAHLSLLATIVLILRIIDKPMTPLIQQGLVNGDPDVDAIFRLTRKYPLVPLEVTFDPSAPPVFLPEGIFSPFNSQVGICFAFEW